jgi:hypothetical protein
MRFQSEMSSKMAQTVPMNVAYKTGTLWTDTTTNSQTSSRELSIASCSKHQIKRYDIADMKPKTMPTVIDIRAKVDVISWQTRRPK